MSNPVAAQDDAALVGEDALGAPRCGDARELVQEVNQEGFLLREDLSVSAENF